LNNIPLPSLKTPVTGAGLAAKAFRPIKREKIE
jgi:hypothetical protein